MSKQDVAWCCSGNHWQWTWHSDGRYSPHDVVSRVLCRVLRLTEDRRTASQNNWKQQNSIFHNHKSNENMPITITDIVFTHSIHSSKLVNWHFIQFHMVCFILFNHSLTWFHLILYVQVLWTDTSCGLEFLVGWGAFSTCPQETEVSWYIFGVL